MARGDDAAFFSPGRGLKHILVAKDQAIFRADRAFGAIPTLAGCLLKARRDTYGLQRISEEQVISSAWTPSFYGYDEGGNVRQLTNAAGILTA